MSAYWIVGTMQSCKLFKMNLTWYPCLPPNHFWLETKWISTEITKKDKLLKVQKEKCKILWEYKWSEIREDYRVGLNTWK